MNDRTAEIVGLLRTASTDEQLVVLYVTRRLMGKGRDNYGPLHVGNDARDFKHEASCEAIDALIYWAADAIKSYRAELDTQTPISEVESKR